MSFLSRFSFEVESLDDYERMQIALHKLEKIQLYSMNLMSKMELKVENYLKNEPEKYLKEFEKLNKNENYKMLNYINKNTFYLKKEFKMLQTLKNRRTKQLINKTK